MDSLFGKIDYVRGKMQSDIDRLFRHHDEQVEFIKQHIRQATIDWARTTIDNPKTLLVILETTPIVNEYGSVLQDHEPIRFTSFDPVTGELYDQLFAPTSSKEVRGAEYHGLTLADVGGKPLLKDVWDAIIKIMEGRHIIIFGADWARRSLQHMPHAYVLKKAMCLHNKCKEYYAEFYRLGLTEILAYQGIDKTREDFKDSRERIVMYKQILSNLAAGMEKQTPAQEKGLDDLPDHPF